MPIPLALPHRAHAIPGIRNMAEHRVAKWSRMRAARGPIAQAGQSRRLITGRSQVRILVGPLSPSREKNALG